MNTKINEVIEMLRPNAEYTISNGDFTTLQFFDDNTLTIDEFNDGISKYDALIAKEQQDTINKRDAALTKLAALGLNTDDLAALGF